ncbi:hypothetical protein EG329_012144 [Mollisiaceae sp. DMI_Dod_QoI]|nr:hypothetical protein EG329_012144 [Helotiales sp. DMI_Dod_QoI]
MFKNAIAESYPDRTISGHTTNYLSEPAVARSIEQCARILAQDGIIVLAPVNIAASSQNQTFCTSIFSETIHQQHYLAYAKRLESNLPPQVMLSDPVVLCDALDNYWAFHWEWISSVEIFKVIMEEKIRQGLEERYQEQGSAKIRNGEFLLQDPHVKRNFTLKMPWRSIMRPGNKRFMSIIFKQDRSAKQSCPHCDTDNEVIEGQPTLCSTCGATYERITELKDIHLEAKNHNDTESRKEIVGKKDKLKTSPELDLHQAFRRLTFIPTQQINTRNQDGNTDDVRKLKFDVEGNFEQNIYAIGSLFDDPGHEELDNFEEESIHQPDNSE